MRRMRRVGMFAAGFAVMMIAGIATAQIGGFTSAEEPTIEAAGLDEPVTEETTSTTKDEAVPEPSADEIDEKRAEDSTTTTSKLEEDPGEEPKKPEADTTPPRFEILHPVDGQVFEQKEVVFEGVTDPDARVFAGDYEADVREDGTWRIVLWLNPGQNVATLTAVDEAGNVTKDSVTVVLEQPEEPKKDHEGDEPKDDEPREEEPKEEKPKEEEPKEEVEVAFTIDQVHGLSDSPEPYEVFWGTGRPGLVIEIISPYGDKRIEVGEKGKWEAKVVFREVPAGKTFEIVVETSDGHRKVFTFTRLGESEG